MVSSLLMVTSLLGVAMATSGYGPQSVTCLVTLVRLASGLSDEEETYRIARKSKANIGL
jgi:lysophospholipase